MMIWLSNPLIVPFSHLSCHSPTVKWSPCWFVQYSREFCVLMSKNIETCHRHASTTSSTHQHYKTILQRWSHRALIVNDTHNNQRKTEPNMVKRLQERAINRDFLEIICYDLITWNWETHKHFSDCNSMWSRIVVDCQIIYLTVWFFCDLVLLNGLKIHLNREICLFDSKQLKHFYIWSPLVFDIFVNGQEEHECKEESRAPKKMPDVVPKHML